MVFEFLRDILLLRGSDGGDAAIYGYRKHLEPMRPWLWDFAPVSMLGGLIGAAIAKSGPSSLITSGVVKVVAFIFISPLLGMVLGSLMMILVSWIFRRSTPRKVDSWSRRLQLISASAYALGHGGNDAQKTIGIIWMLLISAGMMKSNDTVPVWVIVCCYTSIGLGTIFGGWRIIKLMGQKITKLKPVGGFCAETAGAITLFGTAMAGIPVSTTHTITGAIMGVGSTLSFSSVRWGVAGRIAWAWIFTIPAAFLVAALFQFLPASSRHFHSHSGSAVLS